MRVADLPFVLLSYDEPWADEAADRLRALVPGMIRVHGVKGLDACHKAAAEAAGTAFFVTVDADVTVEPSFLSVTIPAHLVSDHVRLTWHSRNAVNGLPSGNGSLKVWPRTLVQAMRTHEAAPEDRVSIDHDLGEVIPGITRAAVLPGIHATTDPARTPEHAFRAGLREAVYLDHLIAQLSQKFGADSYRVTALRAVLTVWINLGRHMPNGLWTIYGARLGLWLEDEVRALGRALETGADLPVAEFGANESRLVAEAGLLPAHRNGDALDGLGWALLRGSGLPRDTEAARGLFAAANALGHPSAPLNLARIMETGATAGGDSAEILRLYRVAEALGNPHAAAHVARLQAPPRERAKAGA